RQLQRARPGAAAARRLAGPLSRLLAGPDRKTQGPPQGDGPMTLPTTEPDEDVMFEGPLDAAPEKVWRALTVPELLNAWLLPARMEAETIRLDGAPQGLP